jgi:RHS repeat-associated protein
VVSPLRSSVNAQLFENRKARPGSKVRWRCAPRNINNEFLYTGRRLDPETGLYQYRHRYYHAQLGRFLTRDPLEYLAGSANLYEYTAGGPINGIDPSGLRHYKDISPGGITGGSGSGFLGHPPRLFPRVEPPVHVSPPSGGSALNAPVTGGPALVGPAPSLGPNPGQSGSSSPGPTGYHPNEPYPTDFPADLAGSEKCLQEYDCELIGTGGHEGTKARCTYSCVGPNGEERQWEEDLEWPWGQRESPCKWNIQKWLE